MGTPKPFANFQPHNTHPASQNVCPTIGAMKKTPIATIPLWTQHPDDSVDVHREARQRISPGMAPLCSLTLMQYSPGLLGPSSGYELLMRIGAVE